MKVTIKCDIHSYDFVCLDTDKISTHQLESEHTYVRFKDKKWIAHAKKHHFNPNKDCYNSRIWDQYLRLCAEGLI